MKTFKRAISCFLALLMIFGSFSVLSYAAFGDGNRKSVIVETKFFVDGEEVTEVKAGDTVKVRIYVATDFKAATTTLFYVYPSAFMEFVNTGLTSMGGNAYDVAGVLNPSETSLAKTNNLGGLFINEVGVVIDSESDADNLIYDGFLNAEYFDDKGWISFTIDSGIPVQYTVDNGNDDSEDDHLAEFTFKVKDDATGEGYFYVVEESIKTPDRKSAFTAVMRAKSDTAFTVASADNARRLLYDFSRNDTNTITLASGEVTPTTYEVKYVYAGDIPTGYDAPEAIQLKEGDAITEPTGITIPDGYTLTWSGIPESGKMGTEAVTVTGTWAKKTYNVTYSFANEGPADADTYKPADSTTTVGATIAAPSTTAPAGWTLTWTATGATEADGSYVAGANNVAFVGTWAKVEYNVTYTYANEAPAGAAAAPAAGKTTVGATIAAPSTAAPAGYTLTWEVTGATEADGSYIAGANDVTFVGTWAKVEYNVTYTYANEAPAGASEAPAAGKTTVGATIAAPSTAAPAGYTLTWESTGATKNADGSYTAGANNVAFVGTWAKVEYDVTYTYANEAPAGANEAPAAGKTTVGATIAAPSTDAPAGYTLTWAATGATKNDDGSYTAGANNVEFVGTWAKIEYDVTYSFDGEYPGEAIEPAAHKTTVGATIPAPEVEVPDGWTVEWNVTGATKNADGSYTAGANDVEFVATFAKKSYTIKYYLTDADKAEGKVAFEKTYKYDEAIDEYSPVVEGKNFIAWDIDIPATMPAYDLEAVAILEDIIYTVTFTDVWGDEVTVNKDYGEALTADDIPDLTEGGTINVVMTYDGKPLAEQLPLALTEDITIDCAYNVTATFYEVYDEENPENNVVYKTYTFDVDYETTEEDFADLGAPTKKGHSLDADAPWTWDYIEQTMSENTYFVANWVANTYTATFTAGEGAFAEGVDTTVDVTFGEEVKFDALPVLEGYTCVGWTDVEGGAALDELVMDEEGKTFYPVFVENGKANYTVEIYLMNETGAYTTAVPETGSATIGTSVTVAHADYDQEAYFSADADAANKYSAVVAEDGSTVLKLYYKRAQYDVVIDGAAAVKVYHGAEVTAPTESANTPAGYELASWNDGAYAKGEVITVTAPLTLTPKFAAGTSTYTVKTYTMELDGEYGAAVETTGTYTTDETVTYTAPAVEGFKADKESYSVKVTGDNLAVIEVYYVRNQYDVVIDGAEAVKVYHGATVTAPTESANTPAGYTLESWNDGAYAKGEVITVTAPLTLTPKFAAGTSAYTVEIYLMDEEGNYAETPDDTDELTGTTDTLATAAHADYAQEAWFTPAATGNVTEATITGDGNAVLKLYYERAQYDVVIDGAEAVKVYYGAEVTAPATSANTPAGYTLASWNGGAIAKGDAVTVTGPLTLTPDFTANTDTKYTVEIYLMDEEGNYAETPDDTDELTGTTDTLATAAHADYAQDAWFSADDAAANVFEANITGDGNAVLKLYYKRAQYDVVIDGTTTPVYHGATITAPAATTQAAPAGYAFAGWNNGTIAAGDEITVTGPLTLEPYFAEGQATYTVEIYLQDAEGNYGAASKTETETGKTGDPVTIAHADYAQEAYYLADDAQANVYEGTIAGDGSLTLKLYFKRATYTVAYEYEDGTAIGEATEVRYGAAIEAPAYDTPDGMNFIGWFDKETNEKMPATMPAKDATYVVKFAAGDSIPYTVAVYMMDVNGEYVVTETKLSGTTGTPVSITPNNNKTGFTVNTEKSNLSDVIAGNGSTVLSVYYDRNLYTVSFDGDEYQVYYGASLPTVEPAAQEGKTFDKWVDADGNTVPASMPAENLAFTSTWTADTYKLVYIINGTEEEYEYAAGAAVTPREDPTVPGMKFIKWNKVIPTVMPAEDVYIVAEFEAAVFKVTFVDGDGNVFDEKAVKYGDAIILPATNPTKEYNVFKGWLDVPATMPAENLTIYPDFEKVPVRLVAAEGSATVIDRSTMIITGLTTKFNDAKKDKYLAVEGDGYYTITSVEGFEGYYGTGAVVKVFDNADTSAPIEVFYIVIYGDVDGDSAVNSVDAAMVEDEALYATNWSRGENKDILKVMAADLNKDGQVRANDKDAITNTSIGITEIDQVSGTVSR